MLPLSRRQCRVWPYVLGITVIFIVYLHFSYTVLDDPKSVKTLQKTVTVREEDHTNVQNTLDILTRRASRIQEICSYSKTEKLMGPFASDDASHLIVDDNTKIMFCFVPKVACTNFKRVFLALAGVIEPADVDRLSGYDVHFSHVNKIKFLKDYSLSERIRRMAAYQKFMFIRDPLERLVSAYRSKYVIHPNPDSRNVFLQKIQSFYVENSNREKERKVLKNLQHGSISFKDFLYYMLDHLELIGQVNEHFVPIVTLCNPCKVKYDYVGTYETLNTEANYIFEKLNIPYHFPARNDNYSSIETKHLVESYYVDLPTDLVRSVWEIFRKDYVIYDIPIPTWLLKYTM